MDEFQTHLDEHPIVHNKVKHSIPYTKVHYVMLIVISVQIKPMKGFMLGVNNLLCKFKHQVGVIITNSRIASICDKSYVVHGFDFESNQVYALPSIGEEERNKRISRKL